MWRVMSSIRAIMELAYKAGPVPPSSVHCSPPPRLGGRHGVRRVSVSSSEGRTLLAHRGGAEIKGTPPFILTNWHPWWPSPWELGAGDSSC